MTTQPAEAPADLIYDDFAADRPSDSRPLDNNDHKPQPKREDEEVQDLQRSRTVLLHNFANSNETTSSRRVNQNNVDLSRIQPPNAPIKWSNLLPGNSSFAGSNKPTISNHDGLIEVPVLEHNSNSADSRLQSSASLRQDEARSLSDSERPPQRGPDRRRGIPHFQQQHFLQQQHFRSNPSLSAVIVAAEGRNAQAARSDPKRQDFGGSVIAFEGYPNFDNTPDIMVVPVVRETTAFRAQGIGRGSADRGSRGRPRVAPIGPRIPERTPEFLRPNDKEVFFDDERDDPREHRTTTIAANGRHFTQPPPVFPPHREIRPTTTTTFRPSQTSAPPRLQPPQPALRAPSQSFGHPSPGPSSGVGSASTNHRRHRPPYGGFEERPLPPRAHNQPPMPYLTNSPNNFFDQGGVRVQPDFRPQPPPQQDIDQRERFRPQEDQRERVRVVVIRPEVRPEEEQPAPPQRLPEARRPNFRPPPPPEDDRRTLPPQALPPSPPPQWERDRDRDVDRRPTTPAGTSPFNPIQFVPVTRPPPRFTEPIVTEQPRLHTQTFPDFVDEIRRPPPQSPAQPVGRNRQVTRIEVRQRPPPPPPVEVIRPTEQELPPTEPTEHFQPSAPASRPKNAGIPVEHGQPFGLIDYPYDDAPPTRPATVTQPTPVRTRPQTTRVRVTTPLAAPTDRPSRPRRPKAKKIKVHQLAHIPQRLPSRPAPLYETPIVGEQATKCDSRKCVLPDCFCGHAKIPGGLPAKDIPQIVLLTFDDAVNDLNWEIYQEIFDTGRKNPNGCPLLATFYVSHEWTDYR